MGVWKNQRLFGDSEMSEMISDLRDEQLFMDESDVENLPTSSPLSLEPSDVPQSSEMNSIVDAHGYEWIKNESGENLYRRAGMDSEWTKHEN